MGKVLNSLLPSLTLIVYQVKCTYVPERGRKLTQRSDEIATFKPKLTVAIDPRDGSPIDAWLSPETRSFLRGLPRAPRAEKQFCTSDSAACSNELDLRRGSSTNSDGSDLLDRGLGDSSDALETVEVPLTSDSEFFQILKRELGDLHRLQEKQQKQLTTQIVKLGNEITTLTGATSRRSKAEVEAWREIFRLYVESQVFFSTAEGSAGSRSSSAAQEKLEEFSLGLVKEQKQLKLSNSGKAAMDSFIQINGSLLQFMKFQEINHTALTKIMKKFDKRTALHSQANLPMMLTSESFIAQDLAKAACFTIQEQLLQIVPQLNDYLCPVCFSISFKPIRLRCNHVFCIRCLIVMQRAKQDHCPLCRGNMVMEASGGMYKTLLMNHSVAFSTNP
jgi:E3 ubiquitin-protein ligase BAH